MDIVLVGGHLRLREHKTVDEIHQVLSQQLAPLQQTISRREILFLKERLKQLLAPVVALEVPVRGVMRDAQPSELQAVAELWPTSPHQICQFHALGEAGRLIYNADHHVKTDMRIRMQERTHAYRHDLHNRLREAEESPHESEQAITQFQILEEYAATVEGAFNLESQAPFQYGGLAIQDALSKIETSLEKLEKGEA